MKKLISLFIMILSCINTFGVGKKDRNHSREIITQSYDTIIKAKILTSDLKVKPSISKQYFWYQNGSIGSNVGGYTGKLLHMNYTALLNNKLVESGTFNKGLKNGKWISWYEDGNIKEICYYRKGILNGKYILLDESGNNQAEGRFRNGKFHKKFSLKGFLKNKLRREGVNNPL